MNRLFLHFMNLAHSNNNIPAKEGYGSPLLIISFTRYSASTLIKLLFVCVRACHTFQYNLTNFESSDILSVNNTYTNGVTKDILSMSNTYTNGATLPVSQLEQGGALAPLKF